MTKDQAKIVLSYAKHNMNAVAAGAELYMHEATVSYHLDKIKKQMGWNPKVFWDLCYLVGIAAQRLGGKNENYRNCKQTEKH